MKIYILLFETENSFINDSIYEDSIQIETENTIFWESFSKEKLHIMKDIVLFTNKRAFIQDYTIFYNTDKNVSFSIDEGRTCLSFKAPSYTIKAKFY